MMNNFEYSDDNKRYHTFSFEMKRRFGGRIVKVPLDAGFTCPNRDGSLGTGGCAYCGGSGAGDFAGKGKTVAEQFAEGRRRLEEKWPSARCLAYFQAFSGTYAPVPRLKSLFDGALSLPDVVGLCVATRPDCLPPDVVGLLAEYAERTFLTVELGLQTVHDRTAERLNRRHGYAAFEAGYRALTVRGIRVCVHLIDSLPGETREMMLASAERVASLSPWGVKLHMLHILKGTALAEEYEKEPFPLLTMEEYASVVCDQLELLPPGTVVERVTGDGPADRVIAPLWTLRKRAVLAAIDREFSRRGTCQGAARKP